MDRSYMTLNPDFWHTLLIPALWDTFVMTAVAAVLSTIFGFFVAVVLITTSPTGTRPNRFIYPVLSFVVNVVRSFPFVILIIAMVPLTKILVGTSIGVKGALVPLTIAATAFIARIIETAMLEVDGELVDGMKSFGLTNSQVVFKVILSEALPATVSGIIFTTIQILGCTALAGTVGAGGIGSICIIYGYQSFRIDIMFVCVIILIICVQIIQVIGDMVYRRLK